MSLNDFLRRLVGCLDEAGVPYMSSGSVASSVHGEPRATQDLDLINPQITIMALATRNAWNWLETRSV
jgi:hypothetical protein